MKPLYLSAIASFLLLVFAGCRKDESIVRQIEFSSVTDYDGNEYVTVKIGEKWWMAENLRVTAFQDGSPLTYIPRTDGSDTIWSSSTDPSYTFIIDTLYGCLYNSQVVLSEKNIAPQGWHIPTDEEWKELERQIGMLPNELSLTGWRGISEAEKLVSKYNVGWPAQNIENGLFGSDDFGFKALPSGCRGIDGRTNIQGNSAFWWTNTSDNNGQFIYRYIDLMEKRIFRQSIDGRYGLSIRCVKD